MTDKDAFCRQILLLEKAMYCLAFSVVRNEADAADVVSEAIFRAYKSREALKDPSAFKPWLLRIVHNTAVESVRKNAKSIPLAVIEPGSEHREDEHIAALSLRQAVDSLAQPYRTVVILHYYEDLPISEISKITGATAVTVKQRLSRARKQLREILKEDFQK